MVCANCGSDSHRTGDSACPKYCTLCAQPGHRQKRGTCPFRVCSICHETGHSARECTVKSVDMRGRSHRLAKHFDVDCLPSICCMLSQCSFYAYHQRAQFDPRYLEVFQSHLPPASTTFHQEQHDIHQNINSVHYQRRRTPSRFRTLPKLLRYVLRAPHI